MLTLEDYRTDSAARRLLAAAIPAVEHMARNTVDYISLVGSVRSNTAGTIKTPDADCVLYADFGDLEKFHLRLESQHHPQGAVYYRLKFKGTSDQRAQLERKLSDRLMFLVSHSKYKDDMNSVPWLVQLEDGEWYLSADNIRILQEGISAEFGTERSETGAAASAAIPVDEDLFMKLYNQFRQRLPPPEADSLLFSKVMPEVVVPYFAREFRSQSLDFDLVTSVRCHLNEATIQKLKNEENIPEKIVEQMKASSGICLTAKVDKIGLGNTKVDFSMSLSHDAFLKKFKGTREVLVIIKDLLAVSKESGSEFRMHHNSSSNIEDFDCDDVSLGQGTTDIDWPKSYHIKTAMANLLEKHGCGAVNKPLEMSYLFHATVQEIIQAYENCYLPSFFDPRINLLLDAKHNVQKRKDAIDIMNHILVNHERLLQICHRRPMALSKVAMGIIKRVIDSDVINWRETFTPLWILNFFLKLGDTGYHDHTKEGPIEANINNALLKESLSILATDSVHGMAGAYTRSVAFMGGNYAANSVVTMLNQHAYKVFDDAHCGEGQLEQAMSAASGIFGKLMCGEWSPHNVTEK